MKRSIALFAALAVMALAAAPAQAALTVGAKAPDFTAPATLGGADFTFKLADALKKGPVVVYFYPKQKSKGCTAEAHAFSEAADEFKANGATLIGMSGDSLADLHAFSIEDCRSKFPIGAADKQIIDAYKVSSAMISMALGGTRSDRTSYVIAPNGDVLLSYSDLNPDQHVAKTMDAVKAWKAAHP